MADRFYRLDDEDADYPGEEVLMAADGWDGLTWWRRALLRVTGLYAGYVIRRTGRQVSAIVRKMQSGDTVSGL